MSLVDRDWRTALLRLGLLRPPDELPYRPVDHSVLLTPDHRGGSEKAIEYPIRPATQNLK